jgi:hypothetical protein
LKIEFNVEVDTLGDTFKALMFQRHKTYRDVATETGVALCTVWRFNKRPFVVKADSFIALWRWMALSEDELLSFWEKETDRSLELTVYPHYQLTKGKETN